MSIALISERTDHFRDFSVWPRQQDFDVEGWLSNFQSDETFIAERLLTGFTYFNRHMTDVLLRNAIEKFFSAAWENPRFAQPPTATRTEDICFVQCQGENPRATDSGNLFARKLRDELRIPDENIMPPLEALQNEANYKHYLFVDDFVGSGNQFNDTLRRQYPGTTPYVSFQSLLSAGHHTVSYCPCLATSYAQLETIPRVFPTVSLYPAHMLIDHHNATKTESRIWIGMKEDEAKEAIRLLKIITVRAGYDKEDGGQDAWHGFHKLGLTIGFEHGIPDASLPIFFSERNGWRPLMRRST